MGNIGFIKTFIPSGDFKKKYELGGLTVYHIGEVLNEDMGAYECYECSMATSLFDEEQVKEAFEKFKARVDAVELEQAKQQKIAEIDAYDQSDKVNGFVLNGKTVWLDKATRVGLMNSTTITKGMGNENTTLWLGDMKIEVNCDKAIQLLSALEMYALECFNVTAAHKKEVSSLESIEEIKSYDITKGYPAQLEMTI